jgi:glycosyltransferase involved in cell wall biosynthesis
MNMDLLSSKANARYSALPKISAIVPVFNTQDYIAAALDSLLNQSVKFHEIIVIDDGSTDASNDILRQYERDGKIKLLTQTNQGQGAARNAGINLSEGDFIYFFDSDDLASPVLVETIHRELERDPELQLIVFSGKTFYDGDAPASKFQPSYERTKIGRYETFLDAAKAMDAAKENHPQPCLYVVSKEVITHADMRFSNSYHEDETFLIHMTAAVGPCKIMSNALFNRRVRSGSTMTMKKTAKHVTGYLLASEAAQKHANRTSPAVVKDYFTRKALTHYLNAINVSYQVENYPRFQNIKDRFATLPSSRLNLQQWLLLIGGKLALTCKQRLVTLRRH